MENGKNISNTSSIATRSGIIFAMPIIEREKIRR